MLMIAWIIILSVTVILLFILLTPIRLFIDTRKHLYALEVAGIGQARLTAPADLPHVELKIGWWRRSFPLFGRKQSPSTPARKPQPRKKKNRKKGLPKSPGVLFRKARRLLCSFRVRHLQVAIDTDDYVANAWLFPLFYFLDGGKGRLSINFQGRSEFVLHLENCLGRIAWSLLT